MSLGHFSYLLSGGQAHMSKVSSERLESLARTAARHFLGEGEPLNKSISKFAQENDLNPHQIARVCEMANIATHQALWSKTAQKEAIAFDLANAKTIIRIVKKEPMDPCDDDGPMVSPPDPGPAPCSSDYTLPPRDIPMSGPSMSSMFGADPADVHQGLHSEPERKSIVIVLQKKAAERQRTVSELLYKGMQLETLEKKAFEAVKQAVMGGATFFEVWQAAAGAGMAKVAKEYLPAWQDRIVKDADGAMKIRLEKLAIHKAPDDLISEDLGGVVVVNGAHPVLVSLDTVTKKTGEIKNLLNNLLRIDDEVKVYKQRIRELS